MRVGTQDKLEIAGMSFASTMSVSVAGVDAVDGNQPLNKFDHFHRHGRSKKTPFVLEAENESLEAMPTFLTSRKSKGNLLECRLPIRIKMKAHSKGAHKECRMGEMLQATFQAQTNS
jgi:hypothetical protein